ncbi:MAG: OFA family MFS transporter [Actinobacteria bacterium]|nr:OFA family MFS transporter [Actinomycetota bacterium]
MPENAKMRRWPGVVGAVLIQLCLGAIYAWSVFASKLKEAEEAGGGGWSNAQTHIVFFVGLAMFALIMVFAGRKLATWGPQRLAVLGGVLLGAGYAIGASAAAPTSGWCSSAWGSSGAPASASATWSRSPSACAGSPTQGDDQGRRRRRVRGQP